MGECFEIVEIIYFNDDDRKIFSCTYQQDDDMTTKTTMYEDEMTLLRLERVEEIKKRLFHCLTFSLLYNLIFVCMNVCTFVCECVFKVLEPILKIMRNE